MSIFKRTQTHSTEYVQFIHRKTMEYRKYNVSHPFPYTIHDLKTEWNKTQNEKHI